MKVVYIDDALASIGGATGIGKYSNNLFNGLRVYQNSFIIHKRNYRYLSFFPRKMRRILYLYGVRNFNYFLDTDLIHYTNFYSSRNKNKKTKNVVTIHDLAAWKTPENFTRKYLHFIRSIILKSIKISDHIITVSNTMKMEINDTFNISLDKISVCYNCVDTTVSINDSTPLIKDLKNYKYILFVGNLDVNKNIPTLISAFAHLRKRKEFSDYYLVIVGKKRSGLEDVEQRINLEGISNYIKILGFISDEEVKAVYKYAKSLVLVSKYEGFGIPIVEAMTYKIPVIASDIPVFHEIGGDAICYYGQPEDDYSLSKKMEILLTDSELYQMYKNRGDEQVGRFSMQNFIGNHILAYNNLLSD